MTTNVKKRVTVGIPTHEQGKSLVATVDSIAAQTAYDSIKEIIIALDGKRLMKRIKNKKVVIKYFPKRAGQSARINNILQAATGDLIVLTNDDVMWDQHALEKIIKAYNETRADLLTANIKPVAPNMFVERIFHIGVEISTAIGEKWKKGHNYLACNGRLIALSPQLAKSISIPKSLWNNDAYIYLYSHLKKFKHARVPEAFCFYQSPTNVGDYIKQAVKFRRSYEENQPFFSKKIASFYAMPHRVTTHAIAYAFYKKPLHTLLYLSLACLTGVWAKIMSNSSAQTFWETDRSTKILHT